MTVSELLLRFATRYRGFRTQRVPIREELPLRSELFSADQMELYGGILAASHELSSGRGTDQLLARLDENESKLFAIGRVLTEAAAADQVHAAEAERGVLEEAAGPAGEEGVVKDAVESDAGVRSKEAALSEAFEAWWKAHAPRLVRLPEVRDFMEVRADFLTSFEDALRPVGLLDRFKVAGVIARWWDAQEKNIKTLMAQGFGGLVESWAVSVEDALERDDDSDPFEHPLVAHLLADFLAEIEEADGRIADLSGRIASFESGEEAEDDDWQEDEDAKGNYAKYLDGRIKELKKAAKKDPAHAGESDAERKALEKQLQPYKETKKELSREKREQKKLRKSLVDRLHEALASLTAADAQALVLAIFREALASQIDRYVAEHRQRVVALFENWWDKYRVTLRDIEAERAETERELNRYMEVLGYA